MSDATDTVTNPETLIPLAERMHQFYIHALFSEGYGGWVQPYPNPNAQCYRVLPHAKERRYEEHDLQRLGQWLENHFPLVSFTVEMTDRGLKVSLPVKTLDSWVRDELIAASHPGNIAALALAPEYEADAIKQNDPILVLKNHFRMMFLSEASWKKINIVRGYDSPYRQCQIVIDPALLDAIGDPTTGELGNPEEIKRIAAEEFNDLFPGVHYDITTSVTDTNAVIVTGKVHDNFFKRMKHEMRGEAEAPKTNVINIKFGCNTKQPLGR